MVAARQKLVVVVACGDVYPESYGSLMVVAMARRYGGVAKEGVLQTSWTDDRGHSCFHLIKYAYFHL